MGNDSGEASAYPTAEEIEVALRKTGFLLEHRVAQSLRKQGAFAEVAQAYPDPESGKSREIDVYAYFEQRAEREAAIDISIGAALIIECKNSSGPFILIGDHGQDYPWVNESILISFDPFTLKFSKRKGETLERRLKLGDLTGLSTLAEFTGYQLLRLNRQSGNWKADNSAIYDSILYPLAKAVKHKRDEHLKDFTEGNGEDWKYPTLSTYFP